MTSNRTWIGAAAIISVVALLAGWFLGISPQLAAAATSALKTAETQALNEVHEAELASMKAEFGSVAETELELVALRTALPPVAAFPDFVRQVYAAAGETGVSVSNFTAAAAVRYSSVPAAVPPTAEGEAAPEETEIPADSATPTTTVPTATSPLVTPENFIVIPITIQVDGGFDSFRAFTAALQTGSRLFLVTGLTAVADSATTPGSASADSYQGTVTGNIYVLADPTLGKTITGPVAETTPDAPVDNVTPTPTPTPTDTLAPTETPTPTETPAP